MSATNDGGAAFPYGIRNVTERFSEGISIRDYFAAAVLQAEWMDEYSITKQTRLAYKVADAMLAERARKEQP